MNFYAQVAGTNLPSNFVFKVGKKNQDQGWA